MFSGVVCVGDKNAGGTCVPYPSFYSSYSCGSIIIRDGQVEQAAVEVGSETMYNTIYTSGEEAKVTDNLRKW
jgi:hypothetical protein